MNCAICNTYNSDSDSVCIVCAAPLRDGGLAQSAMASGSVLQGGAYTLDKVLGQGGFGITYLGADVRLGRPVAIKEFFPLGCLRDGDSIQPTVTLSQREYDSARQRFMDEARVLARFHHPGIVNVYNCFEQNNTAYMVMEYLQGTTLATLLSEQGGRLQESAALAYAERIGEALEAVHDAGLLHRDVKPENVIVSSHGRVVLIDFGTARDPGASHAQTVVVTPGYAPLEQYARRAQLGAYSDVYALAATLYQMLTGTAPPAATDRAAGVELAPPQQLVHELSSAVNSALLWALELKVDRRPQTIRDFRDALRHGRGPGSTVNGQVIVPLNTASPATTAAAHSPAGALQFDDSDVIHWPNQCACCSGPADTTYMLVDPPVMHVTRDTRIWRIPYCATCLFHVEASGAANRVMSRSGTWLARIFGVGLNQISALSCFVMIVGFFFALFLSSFQESFMPFFLWAAASLGLGIASSRQSPQRAQAFKKTTCADLGPAVACQRSLQGIQRLYTFQFQNAVYEAAFRQMNPPRLK